MLLSPSLLVQPTSGFVPFSEGGMPAGGFDPGPPAAADALEASRAPSTGAANGMLQTVWMPRSSMYVRRVETLVLVAVCAYFAFGLGTLGWL
jgi:hypothetical protein